MQQSNSTVDALRAAGDTSSAQDIRALDLAADGADARLAATQTGLVERLIYGPQPRADELQAGARAALELEGRSQPIVEAALGCLANGVAFTADGRLAEELRAVVTSESAYGFTVPVEFGGAGESYAALARVEELLAANGLGPLAVEVSGQLTIGAGSLLGYGSDVQKKTYLPLIADGQLIGFALTEVGVGVNAKRIQAYVEPQRDGDYRLFAEGACNKLWITNATHGALLGIVARIGRDGDQIGLFVVRLPESDVGPADDADYEFRCEASGVAAFTANYNSRLHFKNFPLSSASKIPADGVEVLFYCLRMGRCMLAAMSAGYQRMLACDASYYAVRRDGVGGKIIKHELPRLAIGRMLGGLMQARALAFLALQQDAAGVDLAGLRDLAKSAAASTGLESMIACEHVLGGRSFHNSSRVNDARVNLHLFGVVEGEDDMIRMGMVRDVTKRFFSGFFGGPLNALGRINQDADEQSRILRISTRTLIVHPRRCLAAVRAVLSDRSTWRLAAWIARNALAGICRMPLRFLPGSLSPRHRSLPAPLRRYARFAERKLRGLKWVYLLMGAYWQLELTRAQIPLQRLGLAAEHLVSMLVLCHHAAIQDTSQQTIAVLQAQLLKDKYDAIKLIRGIADVKRLRAAVAAVGDDVETENCSLLDGIEAQPFGHPWDV